MNPALEGVAQLGLAVGLVLFFVWQGSKRENRMARAIDALQQYQQKDLVAANIRMAEVIEHNTEAMERNTEALTRMGSLIAHCSKHANNGTGKG